MQFISYYYSTFPGKVWSSMVCNGELLKINQFVWLLSHQGSITKPKLTYKTTKSVAPLNKNVQNQKSPQMMMIIIKSHKFNTQ